MSINKCKIISINKISDTRGNLCFIESMKLIKFEIKRVYYLYDVPGGSERGEHAHKKLNQLIIPLSGSFNVMIDDGSDKKDIFMNKSNEGLYVCEGIWRNIHNFSSGSVCLVLASDYYDENDYIRCYSSFKRYVNEKC
jgi:dTDP-4-dehydrorhamnose 3,5-epimerase-like enzyme